ncbi:MAG: cupin domain-containing protein [Deltaproteobacteria bacterium]|nr:cupin domain-containing protein [Deltaproteobacteria bacterium]MBI3295235.1 cupin domain-containing protein [Deltaproteobacteria bacterium]
MTSPPQKTEKPWGHELLWAKTKDYVAKILFIKKGESLSLQYHKEKEETLFLEVGDCVFEYGRSQDSLEKRVMKPGDVFHVPPGLIHRMNAVTDCRFFEVSTPQLSDVVRLKDSYGRA